MYGMMERMNDGLAAGEWDQLITLLQRFAEYDLDQHDAWQLETSHGPVFFRVNRQPRPDEPAEAFRRLDTPALQATGRSAQVDAKVHVASRRALVEMAASGMSGCRDRRTLAVPGG